MSIGIRQMIDDLTIEVEIYNMLRAVMDQTDVNLFDDHIEKTPRER